jgi:uncharacterized protein (TIGR02172 family)
MDPILIDLNDYERVGEGANGASYNHKTDSNIMLKMYFRNFEAAKLELELARKVYSMGIPTPEPGDLVTDGKQVGIRFRRMPGKRSYSRACGDEPERTEEYAREFARLCLKLHSVHVDTTQFENVKDRLFALLETNPFFTDAEKEKLHAFIAAQPDTDTAIHGDLQFSNGIFTEENGVRKPYFIDLGDFCYGYPLFDVGMVYLCCCLNDESWTMEQYHMSNDTARRFWVAFSSEYFGPDADPEEVERMILPFAGLKVLIIERDTKRRLQEFHDVLEKTILK